MAKKTRAQSRQKRHKRVRGKVSGTSARPRLNVFRSLSSIYAQLIDDTAGRTLLSASSIDGELRTSLKGKNKTEQLPNAPRPRALSKSSWTAAVSATQGASKRWQRARAKKAWNSRQNCLSSSEH